MVANAFLHPESGMAQGFHEFATPSGGAMMASFMRDLPLTRLIVDLTPPEKWGDYRAQGLTDIALRWLGEADPRPLFLWVHYIDPHTPFQADPARLDVAAMSEMMHQAHPPLREDGTVVGDIFAGTDLVRSGSLWLGPRDRERLRQYYAGEVAYTDTHVGRLFEALRARAAKRPVIAALDRGSRRGVLGPRPLRARPRLLPRGDLGPARLLGRRRGAGRADGRHGGRPGRRRADPRRAGRPAGDGARGPRRRAVARRRWGAAQGRDARRSRRGSRAATSTACPPCWWRTDRGGSLLRANGMQELYDVTRDPLERNNVAFCNPSSPERYRRVLEPQLAALMHTGTGATRAEDDAGAARGAPKSLGYVR